MSVNFCDYFWGEEHNGWNVLYQNMKQGLTASKELTEYFKERGSIDEAYCKSLFKLANKANLNTEKGTLAPIFALLKITCEKMSTAHSHMVNKIQDLVKDVTKYNDELHKKQKIVKDEESPTEDVVKSLQTTRAFAHKAKENYSQRCQDLEKLRRDGASAKEIEKAETKLKKAHDDYKSLVDKYNILRDDFEKKLIQSCQKFQLVEESHLSQVMLFVQTYIDVLQADRKAMSHILQDLTSKYSQLTIDKLLDNFALNKLTGLEKPLQMVFEDTGSVGSAISDHQSPDPSLDHGRTSSDDQPNAERTISGSNLMGGFLRGRRDKNRDKKSRKKKEDSSSIKDEKSDNEVGEELRTVDLISMGLEEEENHVVENHEQHDDSNRLPLGNLPGLLSSPPTLLEKNDQPIVDEEGYTIHPRHHNNKDKNNSFDSSSDSDSDIGIDKPICVKIKPLSNGTSPVSATVDELRATIQSMPMSHNVPFRKSPFEPLSTLSRGKSTSPKMRSNSADLFGLKINSGEDIDKANHIDGFKKKNLDPGNNSISADSENNSRSNMEKNSKNMSQKSPKSRSKNRYGDFSDLNDESGFSESPPTLPPKNASRDNPSIAIPRPASAARRFEPNSSRYASVQSPTFNSNFNSRAESVSSLEFRTSGNAIGASRGPSPLTLGMVDTIPLAVAFQEICHAYFRGADENRVQIKITGEMMISFPAGIVSVLANNPSPAQLAFKIQNFSNMSDPRPNKQLITFDDGESNEDLGFYNFNMSALTSLLKKQSEQNPTASYFNVDIIKYQVICDKAVEKCPLHFVAYWRCEDNHTDFKVDYRYNGDAMTIPSPLLNVCISAPVDGLVQNMHSKPVGQWVKEDQKAIWRIPDLSNNSTDGGKGSLRAKFEVEAGPSTPSTVSCHFNCEGTTLSGLEFVLIGSGYRVSLIKKRFVSGKYICDADAVLRHRYGVM